MGLDWSRIRRQETPFGERFTVEDFAPPGTNMVLLMAGDTSMQPTGPPMLLHQVYVEKVAALQRKYSRVDVLFASGNHWGESLTGYVHSLGLPTPEWASA